MTKSLALLSDAGHIFTDLFAIIISLYSLKVAMSKPNKHYTYGKHRIGVIASLLNNILLIASCIYIAIEAINRFKNPIDVNGSQLFIFAIIGLFFNLIILSKLHGHSHNNLNVQSAFMHILGDTLSSVGVVIVSIAIMVSDHEIVRYLDPFMSIIIIFVIMRGVIKMLKKIYFILMDKSPDNIVIENIVQEIKSIDIVQEINHIHMRTITEEIHEFSAVIYVHDMSVSETQKIKYKIEHILNDKFNFNHVNLEFQIYNQEDSPQDNLYCSKL